MNIFGSGTLSYRRVIDQGAVERTRPAQHLFLGACSEEEPAAGLDSIGEIKRQRLQSGLNKAQGRLQRG